MRNETIKTEIWRPASLEEVTAFLLQSGKKKIKLRRLLSHKGQLDSFLPQESSQGTAVTFILKISDSM